MSRYLNITDDIAKSGYKFRINDLDETLEYTHRSISDGEEWRQVTDVIDSIIRTDMRELGYGVQGSGKPGLMALGDAIMKLGHENRHNEIRAYFESLRGKYEPSGNGPYEIPVVAQLFGNPDNQFRQWLFRWMVGCIAKIYLGERNPMLILVGPQKLGKSYFCQWLCPLSNRFLRDSINPDDKDSHIRLTDTVLWEVEELGATTRRADVEALKAFITRNIVKKRPAYGRKLLTKPAVCSFIGTVNHDGAGFLNDATGTTRFLACEISWIEFSYSQIDVNLLWAEALWFFENVPGSWKLTREEEQIQARLNAKYEVPSAVSEVVNELFEMTGDENDFMTTHDIKNTIGLHHRIGNEQMFIRELARTLTGLGCERGREPFQEGKGHRRGWRGIKQRSGKNSGF